MYGTYNNNIALHAIAALLHVLVSTIMSFPACFPSSFSAKTETEISVTKLTYTRR